MNILVIGNSHVGSIKRAWDKICDEMGDVKLHFIAGRGHRLSHIEVKEGILYSENSLTTKEIEFTFGSSVVDINKLSPDAILLYGMGLTIPFGFVRSIVNQRYSSSFAEQCFKNLMKNFGYRLAVDVASASKADTYIASPFPSAEGLEKQVFSSDSYRLKLEEISFFQDRFLNNLNLNYHLQPEETFNPKCRTFTEFTGGSMRLSVGDEADGEVHPDHDFIHMNEVYGELFIRSFIGHCKRN